MAKSSTLQRGQSAVELALVMPFVALLALLLLQIGLVVRDQLALTYAVNSATRAASISTDPKATATSALSEAIQADIESTAVNLDDGSVKVTVEMVSHTDVPIIGILVPDVHLRASATYKRQ